jgi:hypothetical protein
MSVLWEALADARADVNLLPFVHRCYVECFIQVSTFLRSTSLQPHLLYLRVSIPGRLTSRITHARWDLKMLHYRKQRLSIYKEILYQKVETLCSTAKEPMKPCVA